MLSLKQRIFIEKYFETMSATQAASVAYHVKNRNVAGVIGSENLRKPNIKGEIDKILRLAGIDENTIAWKLRSIIDNGGLKELRQTLKVMNYI